MEFVTLGKTNLLVSRSCFALRALKDDTDTEKAVSLIRRAYEGGINFFDTARFYGDTEQKLGYAFYGMRKDVYISSRTAATNGVEVHMDVAATLDALKSDYVDLYHLESDEFVPGPGGKDGLYDALIYAKADGIVRSVGFSSTKPALIREAVESHLYDAVRVPCHMLSNEDTLELVSLAEKAEVGFLAAEPLAGGLITSLPLAFGFLRQYENVVPLWNVGSDENLQQLLYFAARPPLVDAQFAEEVAAERAKIQV